MAMSAPILQALGPVPGSLRLIALRWALSILAALPGIAAAKAALSGSVGTQPFFTEAPDPLPLPQFLGVMSEVGAVIPVLFIGVVLVWLVNQLLTAAAVEILDPGRKPGRVRLWRTLVDSGWRYLLIYLRVSILALVFLALGARVVSFVFERLTEHGVVEGWTGKTLIYTLPFVRVLVLLAWAGLVGVCAWWCRVILLRGGRRYVRRMLTVVPRVLWRSPVQGFLLHWLLGIASVLLGATVLFAWRQTPGVATGWFAGWIVLLLVQSAVWHWRMRTLSLIWSTSVFDDLRDKPDAPWGVFRWIRSRFRRGTASTPVSPT
jgi:hypothetical protein